MTAFLWRYFRRYSAWTLVAVLTTLLFAGSTVLLLPVFRLILSDVIRTDQVGLLGGQETAKEDRKKKENPVRPILERMGLDVDVEEVMDRTWADVREELDLTDERLVYFLPLLFALILSLRSVAAFVNGYVFQIIGLGATNDLRNGLYDRILHQSSRFYAEHPSGELVSRVSNDVAVMQNAVSNRLLDLFQQSVTLVLLLSYLLFMNLKLALVCFVVVPAVFYPIVRFGQGMRRTSRRSQERLAEFSNLVAEAVRGHRVVKAFGMEGFELARFREATRRHLKVKLKAQLFANAAGPVVETLAAFAAVAFLVFVGHAVRSGELEPSEIMTFLSGLVMLFDPVRRLNKVNLIFQEAFAAAQRIKEVMEIPQDVAERPGAEVLSGEDLRITFEDVSFRYETGDAAVLDSVNLTIMPGEMVALVGPSGAGKSTLVNLLPRFFDPTEGRVTLGGRDLRDLTLESLRAQIGIVTQDTVLFNDTIRNNIAYGHEDMPLERVRAAAEAAYAEEFIREAPEGYDTVIGESGLKLSGGQRQRLAIARAILKDPPILILDEATSHLDSEAEVLVQKALHNLMEGRTALVIAHRLSTVKRADRILAMENGRVVEEGTHAELLEQGGIYRRLHELQFMDVKEDKE